jgi:hypothetical protein
MHTARLFRNCSFLVLVAAAVVAVQVRLFAAMGDSLGYACSLWEQGDGYACTSCSTGAGFPPEWGASGDCDFSGIEDDFERDNAALNYCGEITSAFDATCENEYPDYLAAYHENYWPTWDECYDALRDPECWFSWANASCDAGPQSTWSGDCQAIFWCEC